MTQLRELIESNITTNTEVLKSNKELTTKLRKEHRWLVIVASLSVIWITVVSVFGFALFLETRDTHRQANATADLAASNKKLLELALPVLEPTAAQTQAAAAKTAHNIDCISHKVANLLDPTIAIPEDC